MMKKTFYTVLLMTIIILFSVPALAKYNLTPSIVLKEEYNDNIFLESTDEEDDYITTFSPAIAFKYRPGKALDISLYYGMNFKYYDEHSNLNHDNVEDAQNIEFEAHVKPVTYFFIDVYDYYKRISIDVRKKSALDNLNENMTNSNKFIVSPYLKLPLLDTLFVTTGYSFTYMWYDEDSTVDSRMHSAFFILDEKFSPRISGAIKYEYVTFQPDLNDKQDIVDVVEYDRHEVSASFDSRIRNDIKINGTVGEMWFDYKDIDDKQKFFWNIGIDNLFRFSEYTSLGMNYGVSFRDSTNAGATMSHEVKVDFKSEKVIKLTINPYYQNIEYLIVDRKDKIVGVDSELSMPLSKRIYLSFSGKWEKARFLPVEEEIRRYNFGSNLDYGLSRNIKINIGYSYNNVDATSDIESTDLEINDYDNNIVWLQTKVIF